LIRLRTLAHPRFSGAAVAEKFLHAAFSPLRFALANTRAVVRVRQTPPQLFARLGQAILTKILRCAENVCARIFATIRSRL
jgi:hypothetical protein